jgi:hypothetical protein
MAARGLTNVQITPFLPLCSLVSMLLERIEVQLLQDAAIPSLLLLPKLLLS